MCIRDRWVTVSLNVPSTSKHNKGFIVSLLYFLYYIENKLIDKEKNLFNQQTLHIHSLSVHKDNDIVNSFEHQ